MSWTRHITLGFLHDSQEHLVGPATFPPSLSSLRCAGHWGLGWPLLHARVVWGSDRYASQHSSEN